MAKIIYNITINVDEQVHDKWLEWVRNVHIPQVIDTGCFERSRLLRIHAFEQGGLTYAVQFEARDMESYNRFQSEFSKTIDLCLDPRFSGAAQTIKTVLEVVDTHPLVSKESLE